jgi:hypothetical protein
MERYCRLVTGMKTDTRQAHGLLNCPLLLAHIGRISRNKYSKPSALGLVTDVTQTLVQA